MNNNKGHPRLGIFFFLSRSTHYFKNILCKMLVQHGPTRLILTLNTLLKNFLSEI